MSAIGKISKKKFLTLIGAASISCLTNSEVISANFPSFKVLKKDLVGTLNSSSKIPPKT